MKPSKDRSSTKYPGRVFHAGAWRTPAQIERLRVRDRRNKRRRLGLNVPLDAPPLSPSEAGSRAHAAFVAKFTPEQRSEAIRKGHARRTPEQRSEASRKGQSSRTPEQRSEAGRKGYASRAPKTPEQLTAWERRAHASLRLKRLHEDPVAMKMTEERDPRRAKLIRLAFHPATPIHERRRALDKLIPAQTPAPEVQ